MKVDRTRTTSRTCFICFDIWVRNIRSSLGEQQCFVLWLACFSYAAAKLGSLNNSGLNGICMVLVQCTRTVLAMVSLIKGHSNLIKTHCICHSSNIFSSSQQKQYCFTVAVVFWNIEVNNQGESPIQSCLLVF